MSEHFENAPNAGQAFDRSVTEPEIDKTRAESEDGLSYDEKHLRHNPPEPVPGGQGYSRPTINEVAREELSSSEQAGIREALAKNDRLDRSENNSAELDFNDAVTGKQDWTKDSATEYEQWSRNGEDERNQENTPESAAEFDARMRKTIDERERDLDRDERDLD